MTTPTLKASGNPAIILAALHYLRRLKRKRAEYEEEVRAWYASGDGRSPNWRVEFTEDGEPYQWNAGGRGYRFPACIHGTSLWTDYDNICGPCEDGYTDYQLALMCAHADWNAWTKRCEAIRALTSSGAPHHLVDPLWEWAAAALPFGDGPEKRRHPWP